MRVYKKRHGSLLENWTLGQFVSKEAVPGVLYRGEQARGLCSSMTERRGMTASYMCVLLIGVSEDDVLAIVPSPSYVGVFDDVVVVFAANDTPGRSCAASLSGSLRCAALTTYVIDHALLVYEAHVNGLLVATGMFLFSDMFNTEESSPFVDADELVRVLERGSAVEVQRALESDGGQAIAVYQEAFLRALELPSIVSGVSYRSIDSFLQNGGKLPSYLDLIHVEGGR